MQAPVVVVGSFVQDLIWNCPTFPVAGESVVSRFSSGPGGKGSNQAVACARAGVGTALIAALGDDLFARNAAEFHRNEGVDAHWALKPKHPTGTAGILVNAEGENEIVVDIGANRALARTDLDEKLLAGARVVIAQLESHPPTVTHALRLARQAGALTVLNPAPMRRDFPPALLKHVDVLIPNETEFVALANQLGFTAQPLTERALARLNPAKLHALCGRFGVPVVIVTLGQRGCLVSRRDGYLEVPAFRVKAVDTTGAGDAFVGGFAAGLIEHDGDLAAAVRFGSAVAALSVTKPGAAPSMPARAAINRLLRQQ
jgi:ribokinase